MSKTRPRQDLTQGETESFGAFFSRREPTLDEEKDWTIGLNSLKTTNPDQTEKKDKIE